MSDPGVMEQVTMRTIQVPSTVVLDTRTHLYYFAPFVASASWDAATPAAASSADAAYEHISERQIEAFLDQIESGEIQVGKRRTV